MTLTLGNRVLFAENNREILAGHRDGDRVDGVVVATVDGVEGEIAHEVRKMDEFEAPVEVLDDGAK